MDPLLPALLGTDVSAAQGAHLDWPAIAASGVCFAICKATEHVGYTDPTFARNAVTAAQAGLIVGSYHVLRPEADTDRQARHYFDVAGAHSEMPPVLDFELTGGVAGAEVHRRAIVFVEATEALWGRPCIVYTGVGFWGLIGDPESPALAERPLWVAHYGVSTPAIPKPWRRAGWTMWQFDGNGGRKLPGGIDADFDWFAGDDEALRQLCERPAATCGPA